MTNQEKIRKVAKWQGFDYVHPLTCGNDSGHPNLVPIEKEGRVKLVCIRCGYEQEIPDFVLQADLRTPEELLAQKFH